MRITVVRDSKFRHVYSESWKQRFEDIRLASKPIESSGIKGNRNFVAFPWGSGGGGSLAVLNMDKMGRSPHDQPCIIGHQGGILDFEFDPFDDFQVMTASEDTNVRIFAIPEGGVTTHIKEALVELKHPKKVHLATYHPTVNKVLATCSFDQCVRIWDGEEAEMIVEMELPDVAGHIKWDYNGSRLAVPCKDKTLKILDPRSSEIACSNKIHDGAKASKVCWLGSDFDMLITTGFSSQAERQVAIWDLRKFGGNAIPLNQYNLDQGTGALYPTFDPDSRLLFLAGKGDGNVRYFEVNNEDPYMHYISDYRSQRPQKGFDFLPKHALDVSRHEIMRGLKLESSVIEPVSFLVPRKSVEFQEDLYPETYAGVAVLSIEEWMRGITKEPQLKSMAPGSSKVQARTSVAIVKTMREVKMELAEAQGRILELEAETEKLKRELLILKGGQ